MKNVSPLHTKGAKQVHFLNFQLICEAKYINRFTQKMEANCSDEAHKRVIYLLAENIIYADCTAKCFEADTNCRATANARC